MAARAAVIAGVSRDGFAKIGVASAGRILKQVSALFCENFCSQSLPNFNRKFVQRRDRRNKGDAGRTGNPEIEISSNPLVGNVSNAVRKPDGMLILSIQLWFPRV